VSQLLPQVEEAGHWEDLPFQLPPRSFRARIRKCNTEVVCLVGMAAAKVARLGWPHKRDIADPRRILVIRRGGLGDVLAATPLLRGLREHFPLATISILVSNQGVSAVKACPWVNQIYVVPNSRKEWLTLLRQLRNEEFDTAFILHRFFAASLLALALGIPRRLGFDWGNHGFALTGSVAFTLARSQAAQVARLIELVGKPAAEPRLEFEVDEESVLSARSVLREWGLDRDKPVVGIHPGGGETSEAARRWLPDRFGELADLLVQNGIQVLMLQGPADEVLVREAMRNMKTNLLGVTTSLPLPTTAALIRECDLIIANDSGPMHLAATQNVPVLAIMGPTHPAYNPPRGAMHKVIWAGVPCAPCFNPEEYVYDSRKNGRKVFECWRSTHECMTSITPEQVCSAAVQQIAARGVTNSSYPSQDSPAQGGELKVLGQRAYG
jgi:heptosyltransferase II